MQSDRESWCDLRSFIEDLYDSELAEINDVCPTDTLQCKAVIRAKLRSEFDVKQWLEQFMARTNTNWIVKWIRDSTDTKAAHFIFKKDYVCQLSQWRKKLPTSKKNCSCTASLKFRIKKDTRNTRTSDEYVRRGLQGLIMLDNHHSHPIQNAEAWKWLKPTQETEHAFIQYFESGKSPAEARLFHEDYVMAEGYELLTNSSRNPPIRWVYRLHEKWRKEKYGDRSGNVSFDKLAVAMIERLINSGHTVMYQQNLLALTVQTPMMRRLLEISSEPVAVYIETESSTDQANSSLIVFFAATKAGTIPIGASLHSIQSQDNYTDVLHQVKEIWLQTSPELHISHFIITDNESLSGALLKVWPEVRQLLCLYHMPVEVWKWLSDSKNEVSTEERKILMNDFLVLARCDSPDDVEMNFLKLVKLNKESKYSQYLRSLYDRKQEWCMAYRMDIMAHAYSTNNNAEATFRMIRDLILYRLKSYNSLVLLDYVIVVLDKYYSFSLLNTAYGRSPKPHMLFDKIKDRAQELLNNQTTSISQNSDNTYSVHAPSGKVYEVNLDFGFCSCYSGNQGAYCEHQAVVCLFCNIEFLQAPALLNQDKEFLYYVATGSKCDPTFARYIRGVSNSSSLPDTEDTSMDLVELSDTDTNEYRGQLPVNECNRKIPEDEYNEKVSKDEYNEKLPEEYDAWFTRLRVSTENSIRVIESHASDTDLMTLMKSFVKKLERSQTPKQLCALLNCCQENNRRKRCVRVGKMRQ